MRIEEGLPIIVTAIIVSFVPALLIGDIYLALTFAVVFTGLFILPLTPWVLQLQRPFLERFALAVVLSLAGIPFVYFVIGVLHGPLTWPVFIGVSAIVFAVGVWRLSKAKPNAR